MVWCMCGKPLDWLSVQATTDMISPGTRAHRSSGPTIIKCFSQKMINGWITGWAEAVQFIASYLQYGNYFATALHIWTNAMQPRLARHLNGNSDEKIFILEGGDLWINTEDWMRIFHVGIHTEYCGNWHQKLDIILTGRIHSMVHTRLHQQDHQGKGLNIPSKQWGRAHRQESKL